MNRLALFDCDGTLVDSQATIIGCMETAFSQAGLVAPDRHAIRRIVGLSLLPAVQRLIPDAELTLQSQIAEDYKSAFQQRRRLGLVEEPLYVGITDVLNALDADGWRLGVATGKSDRGLAHCLKAHGLTGLFVTLQTADRHPSKPHPAMAHAAIDEAGASPETTIMIGDTSYDIAMGIAAGARSLGVDWGYHDAHELTASGAYAVAATTSELPSLLAQELTS
jgi:phosphoglycolate phosphatase